MIARQIRGIFDFGAQASGAGIRKGVALKFSSSTALSKVGARAAGLGLCLDEGTLPDSTASSGEPVNLQALGLAHALVPASSSAAIGDQAVADSNGYMVKRTPFSISAFVFGQFTEAFSANSSNPEYRGMALQPHFVEVVRPVTGFVATIGTVTKYMNGIGGAISTGAVPMYLARFDGETPRNLRINLGTAPGGTDTVAVTVKKSSDNGATWSATTLTCTATGTAKTASDTTHAPTLSAGDLLAIYVESSAGTAADLTVTFDVT